jgi:hypothetical protein
MSSVNPIFKDDKIQLRFDRDGFVKIPLLNQEEACDLVGFYEKHRLPHETTGRLHHTTTDSGQVDLIYSVDAKIKAVFLPRLDKILVNFKALAGCFHIKETGIGSNTDMHQDPTFVDESNFCSANVWVALQDTDKENGNLFFIPGSHRAVSSLRATPSFSSYYQDFKEELAGMGVHVSLKKGEAVVFSNATIHGATENMTHQIRLAATLLVCSAQAEWILYYQDKDKKSDKIEKHHLDFDSFLSFSKNGTPEHKISPEIISYNYPVISKKEFLDRVGSPKNCIQHIADVFRTKFSI